MIENIIDRISGDPVLLVVAAIVGIIALLFVAKKLFKIAAGLFLIALVVVVFIYFTSDDPVSTIETAIDKGQETVKEVKEKAKEVTEDIEEIKEKVEENLPDN